MIQLYYWPTPNGHKITIFLEESGLPYQLVPIDIRKGQQFEPHFLRISPNNKMPAVVDTDPGQSDAPISVFESGAILVYLAEKTGLYLPHRGPARVDVVQWLFWQMGGLGPMAGQTHHFRAYASEKIPYAIDRYVNETGRLYAVLDRRLNDRRFVAADYSVADMAIYPWIFLWERQGQTLSDFPNVERWFGEMADRPAVQRAYARAREFDSGPVITEETKKILFGQSAATLKSALSSAR